MFAFAYPNWDIAVTCPGGNQGVFHQDWGGVIYVPGLAENLLSLKALHTAGYKSVGSDEGYEILKNRKVMATGQRTKNTTYLAYVRHMNTLFTEPSFAKMEQHA